MPPAEPGAKLVLLVDDYVDAREMYAEFLEIYGFEVMQASDGEEALAKAAARRPDVVLMDLSLPGVDGREATRRLKAAPKTADVPVVILSGMPAEYAQRSGADAVLSKPCEPAALVDAIRRLLGESPQSP
jgi:CheY-like chemotaxis protein